MTSFKLGDTVGKQCGTTTHLRIASVLTADGKYLVEDAAGCVFFCSPNELDLVRPPPDSRRGDLALSARGGDC